MRMFLRVGSSNGVRKILGDFSSGVFAAFRLFSPRVLLFFFRGRQNQTQATSKEQNVRRRRHKTRQSRDRKSVVTVVTVVQKGQYRPLPSPSRGRKATRTITTINKSIITDE